MGNMIDHLTRTKGFTFLFAFEVEIGYLVGDISLDKDGVRCAAIFYELAACLYSAGCSLMQRLQQLYDLYGYSHMLNRYFFCYDAATFQSIFSRLRCMPDTQSYPARLGQHRVLSVRDVPIGVDSMFADGKSVFPLIADSFMLTLRLEGGNSVTLRNSGTEPKLKYYIECVGKSREEARKQCEEIEQAVIQQLLEPEKNGLKQGGGD
jgi:phosphoglucomutase